MTTTALEPKTLTLLDQARDGDTRAWKTIHERYLGSLAYVARMFLAGSPQRQFSVDDILQECFLKAWSRIGSFEYRGEGSFLAWLVRIVHSEVRNRQRAPRNAERGLDTGLLEGRGEDDGAAPSPSEAAILSEERQRLRDAFASLSRRDQLIVALRFGQEMTWTEIAEALGMSRGAAAQRFLRALEKISKTTRGDGHHAG